MTMDRDALQFTLEWVTSNNLRISGAEVITDLLPIARHIDDSVVREIELWEAVAKIESRRLVGV